MSVFLSEIDEFPADPDEQEGELVGDNPELLDLIMQEKLGRVKTFSDPILQYQYEQFLTNEENLLSLDDVIAMGKTRLGVAMRKGKNTEVAHMMRSVTDAIEKAVYIRERHKEFVHLEQVLWLIDELFRIVEMEVTNQQEVNRIAERLSRLRLIARDDVPLEKKKLARALVDGRKDA